MFYTIIYAINGEIFNASLSYRKTEYIRRLGDIKYRRL